MSIEKNDKATIQQLEAVWAVIEKHEREIIILKNMLQSSEKKTRSIIESNSGLGLRSEQMFPGR